MKNNFINLIKKTFGGRTILFSLIISALILSTYAANAQETEESSSKLSCSMNISYIVSNGIKSVKVQVNRKEKGKTVSVDNLKSPVNLYLNEVKKYDPLTGFGWISNIFINKEGEGIFEFPTNFNKLTSGMHEFTFIAKMGSDPLYEDIEEEIIITDAKITIVYSGEDSVKSATALLTAWVDNAYVPVPEADLKLCIKRSFNFLPFGEEGATTDENGEISGDLPLDLPGNANKTITLAARLEDHETYGTVEVTQHVPWSVLPKKNPESKRTLWSPGDNAPLLLVFSSVIIIVVIWGTIFYLIYLLIKIKRLSKTP